MIDLKSPLLRSQAQLPAEVDRDRDLEGAPACELHLELFRGTGLHIHVVHAKCLVEAKSDLLYQPIGTDVFVDEFDEHSPLMSVFGNRPTCWHQSMSIAKANFEINEVA